MGAKPEDLKNQLQTQRADLSRDIQVIGDRVTPSHIVNRRRAQMRRSVESLRDRVMGTTAEVAGSAAEAAGKVASSIADAASEAKDAVESVPDMARRRT